MYIQMDTTDHGKLEADVAPERVRGASNERPD
jgi:hypothetical protein